MTEAGRAVPEYKLLEEKYDEQELAEALTYCYYVYTKIDVVANKRNMYWQFPIYERKTRVCEQYDLFGRNFLKVEEDDAFQKFLSFYKDLMLTDNDRNYEAFRAKAEHWRSQLANLDNSPKDELDIAKALQTSSELAEDYKVKSELEVQDQQQKMAGLYLFEVPEDSKPHDLRLKV